MEKCKQGTDIITKKRTEIGITCGVCEEFANGCKLIEAIKRGNLSKVIEHHSLQGTSSVSANLEASSTSISG